MKPPQSNQSYQSTDQSNQPRDSYQTNQPYQPPQSYQPYRQTPPGIMKVLALFQRHQLSYLLFKCEHIFEGQNKNLDILFETKVGYQKAAQLLEQEGFIQRFSEKFEKYKMMYCGFVDVEESGFADVEEEEQPNGAGIGADAGAGEEANSNENKHFQDKKYLKKHTFHSIHLHREIAWHGMVALDKNEVFKRKRVLTPGVVVPSLEDSILIHAGHVLFENRILEERERQYLKQWDEPGKQKLDTKYLQKQLQKNHWQYGFQRIVHLHQEKLSTRNRSLTAGEQLWSWSRKLWREPGTGAYLLGKMARKLLRPLDPRTRGCCIALLGVNGSGKTTLAKMTLERYQEITRHLGKQQQYYYFGWNPEFPLTKLLSSLNQKIKAVSFKEMNRESTMNEKATTINKTTRGHFLVQEAVFAYSGLEFLYRYYKNVYPSLRRNRLIIMDRYVYDLYGQNISGRKSLVLKVFLKIFPRPTAAFILDAGLSTLQQREKTDRNNFPSTTPKNLTTSANSANSTKRNYFSAAYLQVQRENYFHLARQHNFPTIDTTTITVDDCCTTIIENTWRRLL